MRDGGEDGFKNRDGPGVRGVRLFCEALVWPVFWKCLVGVPGGFSTRRLLMGVDARVRMNGRLMVSRREEMSDGVSRTAALVSLGCAKNLVDSEVMAAQLAELGYGLTKDPGEASVIVVNSCGFLESAVQEGIETVLQLAELKQSGRCETLLMAGCAVQRYGRKLPGLLPEVDGFLGVSHVNRLKEVLETVSGAGVKRGQGAPVFIGPPRAELDATTLRLRSTPPHSAYVRIADGCDNRCSFCMIPHLRGRYRSRSVEDVALEVRALAAEGVREVNLIAQDTTAFGEDRGEGGALVRLLEALEEVEWIAWIRLLYAYPDRVDNHLLGVMAGSSKVVPYLDVPLQHCVPRILRTMGRRETKESVRGLIERIRSSVSGVAIRTSLMVGFPGETEAEFRELVKFVEEVQLDHAGVFSFSPEIGSRATRLPGQVPEEVREERRSLLMEAQQTVSRRRLEGFVGRTLRVLVEGVHPESDLLLVGRHSGQAPEVDGSVIITRGTGIEGAIMDARVTRAYDYDLEAELVDSVS